MTIDPATKELAFFHHFTQIGGSLLKNDSKKLVALHGFGSSALVVRFSSASDLFDLEKVLTVKVPDDDSFLEIYTKTKFNKLSSSSQMKSFRNFVLLPPFIAAAFLSTNCREPGDLALITLAASFSFEQAYKDHKDLTLNRTKRQ